ncbi:hypothetical protein AVEN_77034-1 [Araneus ventricosus]|uniref:Gustatory receptor n=1 Tax=Araneus ventricosus TaxID=182803 RepID=A0A4Y2G6R3_ARAVE|nr:hypothetical protein AVEN_77034-1 [Araneus ventricosus]
MKDLKAFSKKDALDGMAKESWIQFVMDIIGLSKRRTYTRSLFSVTSIFLHVSFAYSASAIVISEDSIYIKRTLVDIMACSFSVILWHQIQLHSKKFRVFYSNLKSCPRNLFLFDRHEKGVIKMIVLLSFLFPIITALTIISEFIPYWSENYIKFWLLGYSVSDNRPLQMVMVFICMLMYFSSRFLLQSLSVTISSVFSYKLSKAIRMQNKLLKDSINRDCFHQELNFYNHIIKCCKRFENFNNGTALLLIFVCCGELYAGLGIALDETQPTPKHIVPVEATFTIAICIISVFSFLTVASKVPSAMTETRTIFQEIYQQTLFKRIYNSNEELLILKSLGETEPFYFTAGEFFRLDKGLILSFFGTVLTFCILIMQLKRVDLESMN